MIDIQQRAKAFGDLEGAVSNCSGMGAICVILLERHLELAASAKRLKLSGRLDGVESSLNALDFGVRQLVAMIGVLNGRYFEADGAQ